MAYDPVNPVVLEPSICHLVGISPSKSNVEQSFVNVKFIGNCAERASCLAYRVNVQKRMIAQDIYVFLITPFKFANTVVSF